MSDKKQKDTDKKSNVIYVDGGRRNDNHLEEQKRLEEKKKKTRILLFLLVVVVCIAVVISLKTKLYKGYRIISNTELDYENTANYTEFAGNILKYSPDGVSYINKNGDTVWSAGINMKMPILATSGNYAVVADMGGNMICVFDIEGQISSLTMPYSICDVDIASQGAFAVVLESDKTNYVNLYKKNGDIICEMQTTIDKSGYPLDIALSDDGQKLFTSYISVKGTAVSSNLSAYNFGDVGQNTNADRMVGGYMFEDQTFPKVEFIDNDTVVAYGTKNVYVYSMKEKPKETAKISFDQEIRSVFYNEGYIGVVRNCKDGNDHKYIFTVYDTRGKEKMEKYVDFDYSKIHAAKKEIIITGDRKAEIIRINGSVKFNCDMGNDILSMVPNGKNNEYIVVFSNATQIIKLKSEKGVSGQKEVDSAEKRDEAETMDSIAVDTQTSSGETVGSEETTGEASETGTQEMGGETAETQTEETTQTEGN